MDINILKKAIEKGNEVFVAPSASVMGNVKLGSKSSVWYGAVVRGDSDKITIGECTNIQDNATIHVDPGFPVSMGSGCTIGHNAIVHGASLGNNVLIGMGSIIMNGVEIGDECIIGAGSVVTSGTKIPARSLVLGSPAKVVKPISDSIATKIIENWEVYVQKASVYLDYYKK